MGRLITITMPETIIELGVSAVSTDLPGRWLLERRRFSRRDGRCARRGDATVAAVVYNRARTARRRRTRGPRRNEYTQCDANWASLYANQSIGRLPTPVQRDAITNIAILLWHYGSPSSSLAITGPDSPSRRSIRDNSVTSHRDARDNARSAARGRSLNLFSRI